MTEQHNVVKVPVPSDPRFREDVRAAISRLKSSLMSPGATPAFGNITLDNLTADQIVATDADKSMQSISIGTGLDLSTQVLSFAHLGLEDLTDPDDDRIFFWDDSEGKSDWLDLGNSLAIMTTTIDTIQDIRTSAGPEFASLTLNTGGITLPAGQGMSGSSNTAKVIFDEQFPEAFVITHTDTDNLGTLRVYPNGDPAFSFKAALQFFNSDYDADSTNYEVLTIWAYDDSFRINAGYGGTGTSRPIYIHTSGQHPQLVIHTDGSVGVGTVTPNATLDVVGDARIGDSDTNYSTFAADGELTLAGTARIIKEVQINPTTIAPGASGPTDAVYGTYSVKEFSVNDDAYAIIELPHDWASGTDISVYIEWAIDEAYATNSGEVQWQVAWSACPTDASEDITSPTHTGTIDYGDQNIPDTANYLTITSAGVISGSSLSAEDAIGLHISRVALDDGSNPTAEPAIVHIQIHYIANKLGIAT